MALDVKSKFKGYWGNLDAESKKKVVRTFIIVGLMVFGIAVYYIKYGTKIREAPQVSPNPKQEIKLEPHLLEKSAYLQGQEKINTMLKEVEDLKKELKEDKNKQGDKSGPAEAKLDNKQAGQKQPPMQSIKQHNQSGQTASPTMKSEPLPPPPIPPSQFRQYNNSAQRSGLPVPPAPGAAKQHDDPPEREYGAIEIAGNRNASPDNKERAAEKKSKKKTVYLPPSFMEATMLSGLDAPTTEGGKGQPVPVLLRIRDLAFLPNQVRANLKGCFVISEGHGSLADERAHLRITSISCLSKKGTAVIDQHAKGFVVDSDGKIGLRGTVVSKMGSIVARSVLAGFFSGIGDAIKQQTTISSISPLGQTLTIDPNQVLTAGVGGGISSASQQISKFYLELARQTMPVIEVGALRDVTLVISEGVELEIKEINKGEELP
jgi:conjugal transfer pilus assembly protein TraB